MDRDNRCKWEDMAVIGMYLDKLSMLAKGKYFSSRNLTAVVDCLKLAERCLAEIETDTKGFAVQCPEELTHEDCFCMPS